MTTDIFNKVEDLHPDLMEYQEELNIGTVIRHPLVYSVPHFEGLNAYLNQRYKQKQEAVARAEDSGDCETYLCLHERPYRFAALSKIEHVLSDEEFWPLFVSCWTDSENLWQVYEIISPMLRSERGSRECMMNAEEREEFNKLPAVVTIYRGHRDHNGSGFSWTLSKDKARWFAKRFDTKQRAGGFVTTGKVRREDIVALLLGRGEQEVICFPETITHKRRARA